MGLNRPFFPIDEAYLIGGWLESFFWGLFTFLFGMTIYSIYRKRREGFNRFTTASIVILYILATVHMALALVRLIQGFILYRDTIGTIPYFANISVRLNMAKDCIYITNLAMGDLVIAWRLYVVWGKKLWIAIPPTIMVIGEFICGYGSIFQWLLPHPNPVEIAHWGQGIFVISLAANIVVTALIAARIWYMTTRTRELLQVESTDRYSRVIMLIVESGALIAVAKIVEFTLFKMAPVDGLHGLNALYVVYEIMPQVTGLAPTVIVYAVNNGFTQKDDCYTTAANTKSTLVFNSTRTADSDGMATSAMEFADPKNVIPESRATGRAVLSEKKIQLEMLASPSVSDTSSPV
ncbi:hypothetical protein OH76DRAFT_1093039 [Lentinus brumalis]|uniref:Uncharacterized protein n=1 Tax=Lentinus brumalis TaxID=2498619 RepID=A0A371CWD1_9APHY|nr:hypothetical protein OH76DRAFT_1093039 [Polyporus brumalis]